MVPRVGHLMGVMGEWGHVVVDAIKLRGANPAWLLPLSIFLVTQAVAGVAFYLASGGHHSAFVALWDGVSYTRIARDGYPGDPGTNGIVAFYPLYPMIVRGVAFLTPLGVAGAGPLVSLAAGAVGVVVLFRTVERHIDRATAVATAVLVCTWMAAPVLQMTYSEGLALCLLALAFELLLQRRYGPLLGVLVLLSLCRPLVIPFALVVAVHAWARWRAGAADRWRAVGVLALCVPLAMLWPVLAGIITGVPDAYFLAMAAWQVPGMPRSLGVLLLHAGPIGWAFLLLAVGALLWVAARVLPAGCPVEYRAWVMGYPLYILGATYMSGSVLRYMLFAFPVAFAFAPLLRRGRGGLVVLLVMALVGSTLGVFWVNHFVGSGAGPIP